MIKVLFIEDDAMNRRVVRDMLSVVGAEMAEAPEAATGLAMIGEGDYDVILMDLRMAGMDGLTAIRHLRARTDAKRSLPIIVVTADTAVNLRATCLAAGADEVILKPVAMNVLFDAISQIITRSDTAILD
ncbi:MAG: response regulator [Sphingomonas bacterium]|nr:response regulator [Sphingomonas bacterium]